MENAPTQRLWSVRLNADAIARELTDQNCLVRGIVCQLAIYVFQTGTIPETHSVYRIVSAFTPEEQEACRASIPIITRLFDEISKSRAHAINKSRANAENGKKGGRPKEPIGFAKQEPKNNRTPKATINDQRSNDLTNNDQRSTINDDLPDASHPRLPQAEVQAVFSHWQTVMGKARARLDEKRIKLIRHALRNYSEADLCDAINGCRASPFHMGENDRHTRFDGIELILRDSSHIDKFISFSERAPTKVNGFKDAIDGFVEEINHE